MRPIDKRTLGDPEEDRRDILAYRADPSGRTGRRAVSDLMSRYGERVYGLCRRYTGDSDRAMDMAQDALLSAYRKLDSLGDETKFRAWLFAIARNRCLSEFRRVDPFRDCAVEPDSLTSSAPDPAERLEREMDLDALRELMARHLDAREQEALSMRCVERMSVESITEAMRLTDRSGARGLLQKARRKLRAALEDVEGGGSLD